MVFPWGVRDRYPTDRLGSAAAQSLLDGHEGRLNVTPGIFVDRVVEVSQPQHEAELIAAGERYP